MPASRPVAVVVLAAGEGTRMRSATAKVLHTLAGRSMLGHVVAAARVLDPEHLIVVVGHARESVTAALTALDPAARAVVQAEQNGTGHAVRIAVEALAAPVATALVGAAPVVALSGTIVVVPGDAPLLTAATLQALVEHHERTGAATTLLTAVLDDPTGYGRVVRDDATGVTGVVEHKDATEAQRAITEVATSVYAFDAEHLVTALGKLLTDNAQGEEYLTDVVGLHHEAGLTVAAHVAVEAAETMGVNDRAQLAEATRELRDRIVRGHLLAGVAIVDPCTAWIDVDVVLEPDATVLQDVQLRSGTVVRRGAVVGPSSTLVGCEVGPGATVLRSHCVGAVIGAGAEVGPFTYLRPGTQLGVGAKAGAYVEIKNSRVGDGSKVPHLSYVGDATIGERSNIGAGTIVVNYDGRDKHQTTIGSDSRVGSNNSLIAPVAVGDNAYTAAGSSITADVPDGALGVGREQQRNIYGWVARRRPAKGENA